MNWLAALPALRRFLQARRARALAVGAGHDAAAIEQATPAQEARLRLPWLLLTMLIEMGAGGVVAHFDQVLKQAILLASFMPVISAISGNVGLQAAAIMVRALDTGSGARRSWRRALLREMLTTLFLAVACAAVLGTIGAVWSGGKVMFGVIVGAALLCSMSTAGCLGTLIPMLSQWLGFDPATTAGPFETSLQDVVGFATFLWLADHLLRYVR